MTIPFIDLKRQYEAYKEEIDAQVREVIESTAFIMGPKVAELEEQLRAFVGVKHAISCSSGTDALMLALMAHDVQPGDEIITTPFTFIATSEVIALLKAKPVFVDIDARTFNIDVSGIEAAVTDRTRGIIAVDLFGQCADYDAINRIAQAKGLFVVEDAAQAFGARYKGRPACSLSGIGCTSFFPAKPLGCFGDGGAVFTDDDTAAEVMRSVRIHGKGSNKYDNVRIGLNARIDTLQAAVLLPKLKHYEEEIGMRGRVAERYARLLEGLVRTPVIGPDCLSVYAQYSVLCEERDRLQQHLKGQGVPTAIHYPTPLHLQPAFAGLGHEEGDFPVSEATSRTILALPMHPFLSEEEQETVAGAIKSFYNK